MHTILLLYDTAVPLSRIEYLSRFSRFCCWSSSENRGAFAGWCHPKSGSMVLIRMAFAFASSDTKLRVAGASMG